jgi:glycosyltransferase involved in cell wall biosynthesis
MRLFRRSKKNRTPQTPPQRRVLFVSHEATRTGAPKIILNILKHFARNCDIQCETILQNGGDLISEFEKYSTVDCLNLPKENSSELKKRIGKAISREKNNIPVLAICNSMESRYIAKALAEFEIPVMMLVHELPSSYSEEDYQGVYETAQKVVFPVNAVQEAANEKTPIPMSKSIVLSQGLLDPTFGTGITREVAYSQIRKELHLPESSFIVLGCGSLDLRKGIDHYANIARRVVQTNHSNTPVHFVWVGEGARWTHSPYHYVQLDLDKTPARDHVHFIGERNNVEPYFVGADAFMMSSRVDPFPCVIHEAMASSLPVITFADSGGASEAIDNGAGFIVPYANYEQAANVISLLANQPEIAAGIREKSKERVFDRYRFEDYGDKLIDLAESIIQTQMRVPATLSFPTPTESLPISQRRAA